MTDMKENETEDERLERIVRKVLTEEVTNVADKFFEVCLTFFLTVVFLTLTVVTEHYLSGISKFAAEGKDAVMFMAFIFSAFLTLASYYIFGFFYLCVHYWLRFVAWLRTHNRIL